MYKIKMSPMSVTFAITFKGAFVISDLTRAKYNLTKNIVKGCSACKRGNFVYVGRSA